MLGLLRVSWWPRLRFSSPRPWLAAAALCAPACSFDLDKLYTAGLDSQADAGSDGGVPDDLIELFTDSYALGSDCLACARSECADVNATCRADAQCTDFTACVAERDTPAQREHCRALAASWLGEDPDSVLTRDLTGPLGQCVLSQRCADVCRTHQDVSCLDSYTWPTGTSTVTYRLRLTDTDYGPISDASVRVCGPADTETCSGTTRYTSDAEGIVDVPLPASAARGFVGYLEIEGHALVPQLVRFGWPVAEGTVMNLAVITEPVLVGLSLFADKQLSDEQALNMTERGMVQVRITGCSGVPLSGALVSVAGASDPQHATWYAKVGADIAPDFTATESNALGAAGIINILPGPVRIQTSIASSGRVVSDVLVPIRAGYITTLLAVPATD